MTEQDEDTPNETESPAKKRRWPKVLLWVFIVLVLVCAGLAIAAYSMIGKTIAAPDWVREEVQSRVNMVGDGRTVEFGTIEIVVPEDFKPQVRMKNLDIRDDTGTMIAQVASADFTVEVTSFAKGQVRANHVAFDGANISVRRFADGSINLSLADAEQAKSYENYGALLDALDDVLKLPELERLDTVSATGLIVNYSDERAGRTWTADGGRISVLKTETDVSATADIALLAGRDYVTTLELSFFTPIYAKNAEIGVKITDIAAEDIATQSPALAYLGVLDAPISGAMRTTLNDKGELGPLSATLEIGEGALKPTEQTRPIKFTNAKSYFTYDPQQQTMVFDVASVDSEWGKLTSSGNAFLTKSEGQDALVGQFTFEEIELNPYDIYPQALAFDAGALDFQLKLNPFTFRLGHAHLTGQDQSLTAQGQVSTDDAGWNVATDVQFEEIEHADLLALWPADLKDKTRNWMNDNIQKATYFNVDLALRARANERPNFALGFEFKDTDVQFMKTMPVVKDGRGVGSLIDNAFVVSVEKGSVTADAGGALNVAGSVVTIPDVSVKQGPIDIALRAQSTVTAVLSVLDREPFQFLSKAGLPVTMADGRARVQADIGFDLKPKVTTEEVTFTASADVTSVRSDQLIKGRTLTASTLNITADNGGMAVRGAANLGQIPATGVWSMAFGPAASGKSQFEGSIELSQAFVDEFNIGLPSGSVRGRGKGQIVVDLERNKPPRFALVSDLNGVRLALDTLGWVKSANTRGKLEVSGALASPPQIDRLVIDAGGLKTAGSIRISDNGSLASARFDRVQLGGWLDAPVRLTGRGKNQAPQITLLGGRADMRKAAIGANGQGGGGPLTLQLDRLTISDSIALTNFKGDFDGSNGLDGRFTANVNGGTAITGTVVPRNGKMGVRIQSDNAGGALKSAGILNEGRGGTLSLALLPTGAEGTYDGQLRVRDIGITDAPALAALISAASVVGLLEQMSGNGIKFTEIDADFRLSPSRAVLTKSSAIGPSLGISLDGIYNFNSKSMDFQGVFSPIYLLNGIGSFLTRKGEGLLGFNYTIKGNSSNPRVGVNPLSILTPGMFREIFRKPAPTVE